MLCRLKLLIQQQSSWQYDYVALSTVYVEIFTGILFREIVKRLSAQIFHSLKFCEYAACLILRPFQTNISGGVFS